VLIGRPDLPSTRGMLSGRAYGSAVTACPAAGTRVGGGRRREPVRQIVEDAGGAAERARTADR
jgi:hypothetical protein